MAENLTPKKYIDSNNMKQILTAIKDKTPIGGEHVTADDKTLWNTVEDKVDKTSIVTALDNSVTDEQVTSALLTKTELGKINESLGNTDISSIGDGTVTGAIDTLNSNINHNIPRLVPKNITSYYTDGTLWDRLNGTNGFSLFEDIFVGDYIKMSRPISAYSQDQTQQLTGSQYVTIAGIDTLWGSGDNTSMVCHHLVMIPGQGFGGTQHFGRSRMNPTDTTESGYATSEMHTTTLGAVTTSASTETTATINQQLYAEFGSHLKTTRELLSRTINPTGYNRFGSNTGCSNSWAWTDCQAVLMSEIEVYGSIVWGSSGYDIGTANKQLPLFVNSKQAINDKTAWYWLKDIASASSFCGCDYSGVSDYNAASFANRCVRPRFVIAK